jgi:Na+-translocating ferredoxin:NAD+ oxidoreductase RnfG subunit
MLTPFDAAILMLVLVAAVGFPLVMIINKLTEANALAHRRNELCDESNNMIAAGQQYAQALAEQMAANQREHFAEVREQLKDYE